MIFCFESLSLATEVFCAERRISLWVCVYMLLLSPPYRPNETIWFFGTLDAIKWFWLMSLMWNVTPADNVRVNFSLQTPGEMLAKHFVSSFFFSSRWSRRRQAEHTRRAMWPLWILIGQKKMGFFACLVLSAGRINHFRHKIYSYYSFYYLIGETGARSVYCQIMSTKYRGKYNNNCGWGNMSRSRSECFNSVIIFWWAEAVFVVVNFFFFL